MLLDTQFLLDLDQQQNTEKYARVTLLNNRELPIEQIEGRITSSGSINIDGNSAIRRSCSLTMVSNSTNYHEHYWTLKSKFKLEVGIRNTVSPDYPEIIWFPQGIYIFTSFSTSHSVNNFTISLQGKDKGCLINGEIAGTFNSSVDLGAIETIDEDGNSSTSKIEIKDILVNLMHQYAGEPFRNIIINDLNEFALELLEYRYENDLFLYRQKNSMNYDNMFLGTEDTSANFYYPDGKPVDFTAENIEGLETLVESLETSTEPSLFKDADGKEYYIARVKYGQAGGYKKTNLVYPGELIANVGETITSVLDKIKNMLGHYEYFYDVEGRFVFQKKRYFVNSPIDSNTNGDEVSLPLQEEIAYTFKDLSLAQSFNNNPNLSNLKNDFSIWGERKSITGASIPIHLRYALDEKPTQYTSISVNDDDAKVLEYNTKYKAKLEGQESVTYIASDKYYEDIEKKTVYCDWREVIYQMASDHFKYGFLDDFETRIIKANGLLYFEGVTGYEQYYTDLLGFWRDLYTLDNFTKIDEEIGIEEGKIASANEEIKKIQNETISGCESSLLGKRIELIGYQTQATIAEGLYWAGKSALEAAEWLYDKTEEGLRWLGIQVPQWIQDEVANARNQMNNALTTLNYWRGKDNECQEEIRSIETNIANARNEISKQEAIIIAANQNIASLKEKKKTSLWNKSITTAPETLNFWFDFLDTEGEVAQYSVRKIGVRTKTINDNSIKAIYFRKTPEVIFAKNFDDNETTEQGYRYIQVEDLDTMFSPSAQGRSAKEELDNLLQTHLFTIDSISLPTKPIYYLEPNSKIRIIDEDTNTFGDYIISKLTLPLTYNGMMSITASKAVKNIF